MEKFKQQLRHRIFYVGVYCGIVIALNILAIFFNLESFAAAFASGVSWGIGGVMIFYVVRYRAALKDEEKLKKLYIEENDERQKLIDAKIGSSGIDILAMFLLLAMIISNFFNQTVFYTLFSTVIFIILVKFALKFYYNKKF